MSSLQKNERLSHFHVLNSTVASACVLSMCITVLIVFETKDPFSKHEIVGYLIVPFITLLGMIVTFFIWISLKRNTKKKVIKKQRIDVTSNFKLTFLWIFGLASIFNTALNMGMSIDSLFLNVGCQLYRAELYKISIAIYLVEICFCAGQLGFLSLYGKFKFRPSHLINFGASQMIVTHFLRWFQIPFSEVFWTTFDFHFHFDWNATSKTIFS